MILLIALVFVVAGLYTRHQFGGRALVVLWAGSAVVMAATDTTQFIAMIGRVEGSVSTAGRGLAVALMLLLMTSAFGTAALAIHRGHADDGPWLTPRRVGMGALAFAVGLAGAYAVVVVTIVLVGSQALMPLSGSSGGAVNDSAVRCPAPLFGSDLRAPAETSSPAIPTSGYCSEL
jgi:hypothetical protein